MANQPIFPQEIKSITKKITDTDGVTIVDAFTAGSGGARIDSITVVTDEATDRTLSLYINDGTNDFLLGKVEVKAGSGTDGTNAAIAVLTTDLLPGLKEDLSLYLQGGYKLRAGLSAALTAGKILVLTGWAGNY